MVPLQWSVVRQADTDYSGSEQTLQNKKRANDEHDEVDEHDEDDHDDCLSASACSDDSW